ncbi:MAG: FAD-dependent oxidoreductase [Proteobacteria bacterium]|nr:FAD-dependent oxidoreductase [Pseudomonadota bacterium]MBU1610384.1 FAD-dependent oxidoreductase [Pseudomonadota bacterium]
MKAKYLIIGAGPTGLGAANRLRELGCDDFLVLEKEGYAGGLATSFRDSKGFTWDIGGHVLFSHYDYYDRLVDEVLEGQYLKHERESWVRAAGTWTPYPFQNNIRHLPPEVRWNCVAGLLPGRRPTTTPANFHEWIETVFGSGIGEAFMWPYNFKVWATPPRDMAYDWIGERVSLVDLEMVLKNIVMERDDAGWGPNNTFLFPLHGGTGQIFTSLARRVEDRIRYNEAVVQVDAQAKTVTTATGAQFEYETLLTTAPLDLFCASWLLNPAAELVEGAGMLEHNSVWVGGVGVDTTREDSRCWMYFPDQDSPCYRVTNFHNYSPNVTARPGQQRAYMCEVSYSKHKQENLDTLMDQTVRGLVDTTLMTEADLDQVVSRYEITREHGYPVPTLGRDTALRLIQPRLEAMDIFSRGRFGGWKYEVANMDHSVMQGVEWAQRMVENKPETTYTYE